MSHHDRIERRKSSDDPRLLDNMRRSGVLTSAFPGIYVPAMSTSPEREWLNRLAAAVVRAGPGAAAGHRSAARLHGWDGFDGPADRHIDVIAPMRSTARGPWLTRSRTLDVTDLIDCGGIAVTSPARTLCDLGRKVGADQLERALESALRGPDPSRPDISNHDLLSELVGRCATSFPGTSTGISSLKLVLMARRADARPTGSFAETFGMQALRAAGFYAFTQARIIVSVAGLHRQYWTDLGDLDRGLVVEIEGPEHHGSAASQDRDHGRQNVITDSLTMLRFSAASVIRDPTAMVTTVMRKRAHLPIQAPDRICGGFRVQRLEDGWRMTRIA